MDEWDKLKPYGIAVHGCVDGFSRHIVWLEAPSTNNNPRLVGGYYVKAVALLPAWQVVRQSFEPTMTQKWACSSNAAVFAQKSHGFIFW